MRFSPVSGTTSATVASATRSRKWSGRFGDRPSAGTSAWTSLNATPLPQRGLSSEAQSGRRGAVTAGGGGGAGPGGGGGGGSTAEAAPRGAAAAAPAGG